MMSRVLCWIIEQEPLLTGMAAVLGALALVGHFQ